MSNEQLAREIVDGVGGKNNLTFLENCMTRVRIDVRNPEAVDVERLKMLDGIMGVVCENDNIQLVVGTGKCVKIVKAIEDLTGFKQGLSAEAAERKRANDAKNETPVKLLLKNIAQVFVPIIPAFVSCGLLLAIYEFCGVFVPELQASAFGHILNAVASSVFTILPIIVGYNAAKQFGGTAIIGAVLASILNAEAITGISLFGIEFAAGRGGIIAVLVAAALGAQFEKQLRKVVPDFLDLFLTPLVTVFVMTFASLLIFQPIAGFVSTAVGDFVSYIIYNAPALAGLATLVYLPLVMTGMHHGLIAVNAQLIADFGVTYLLPVTCMAGAGQVGAALYVYLKTKNKSLKKICRNALPVGVLGIGEPLMWGATIPLGKPFIASCIGGAVGGSAMAMMHVAALIPELSGIQLSLITTSPIKYLIGLAISYAAGFVVCMILGFDDPAEEAE